MELSALDISKAKENQFIKKGICSGEDLVQFLPRKYNDFTKETGILPETELSCIVISIEKVRAYYNRTPFMMAQGRIKDSGERISVKWFNQNYLLGKVAACEGKDVYVAGKVTYENEYGYSIVGPEVFESDFSLGKRVVPVYSKIAGMSSEYLAKALSTALSVESLIEETCPHELVKAHNQIGRKEALRMLHFPQSMEEVRKGQERILFDDLLYFALRNEWAQRSSAIGSPYSVKTFKGIKSIKECLPYTLTEDQANAINSMILHVREGKRINALVQGDVGCGKSIVSFLMMVAMADSGYQAVLMAPTQVLAQQHYEELSGLVEPLGYKVVYLGGKEMKSAEKKAALAQIADGTANLIVGTHSVLGNSVKYKNLALTIADEEHKFGVAQRTALIEKASSGVHSITMSATPIPRSLAQVVYGSSVQLHTIKTMPHGRKPVKTGIFSTKEKLFRFIINQARKGFQTYVVCPMIDANDKLENVRSIEEVYADYKAELDPYGIPIATLTGKNTKVETESIIERFKQREVMVLIATTVIEVGVNVPTATTMVITNAERFGLSSLHQLRGRVGRGEHQSFCVLESVSPSEEGMRRLEAMVRTTDGFEIAKEDLAIRGAGDFLGTKQSGDNKYMALMLANPEKYAIAQQIAKTLLDNGTQCKLTENIEGESELSA